MEEAEGTLLRFVRRRLPVWYRRHRRDLPWRGRADAYAIWVSEIMLQQTRVETVVPYFRRWLRRFPDVRTLAAAAQDDVLKAWEGLGYYSRARNLHRAAKHVMDHCGGRLPRTARELAGLPGIGRYTAGAIASIAFGLDEPVLDGNVTRVLCRVFLIRSDPKASRTQKRLWALARGLIPSGEAGGFNQAMMELGATVCLPRGPLCLLCPLREVCRGRAAGEPERLPRKAVRKPTPHVDVVAALLRERGRVLIAKRPEDGLLGGLWELPGGRIEGEEGVFGSALAARVRERLGVELTVGEQLTAVRHAFTHFRITLHVFACRRCGGRARPLGYADCKWVAGGRLGQYAFPTAQRKALGRVGLL